MITRTKRVTLTFKHPFSLKGVDRPLAPGKYEVVSDEELIEELSFPVYRRVSTLIFLPPHGSSSIEMVNVDPRRPCGGSGARSGSIIDRDELVLVYGSAGAQADVR
jgi:hypothetical protein